MGFGQIQTEVKNDLSGPIPIKEAATSVAVTSVSASASSQQLLAANTSRLGASFHNDQTTAGNVAPLYIKLGGTASTTDFTVKLVANAHYELPYGYTGAVHGIWGSGGISGLACRITEFT